MSLILAVILDFLIGDPVYNYHPIRIMGRIIRKEEEFVRAYSKNNRDLFWGGLCMLVFNLLMTAIAFKIIILLLNDLGKFIFSTFLIYSAIATRDLIKSAKEVDQAFDDSIEMARYKLSMIVGRDTENLSKEGIVAATVETVAENTSDGIIAPLFYILLFGPVGGMMYKFVNTMDSTIGYRNEKYEYLGKAAALFDDFVNYLPARITGLLFVVSAFILDQDYRNAYRIMRRDAKKHSSPNAGYPEAAMAGMLNIRLGGPSAYEGVYKDKAYLGDPFRKIERADILRANRIAVLSEMLFVLIMIVINIIKAIFWR